MNALFSFCNTWIFGFSVPIFLFCTGLFFLFRLRFFHFVHPVQVIRTLLKKSDTPDAVSPFKAVTMALAGTLGVGNIVGVATAITAGGAGAIFWMWISAILSMIIKYSEIVLAVHFRQKEGNQFHGGAMYYIQECLGKNVAGIFTILCLLTSFAMGNLLQVNAIAVSFSEAFHFQPIITGIIVAILTFLVISRGVKGISDFTVKLIPLLSIAYILFSLYILLKNFSAIPAVFRLIVSSAFDGKAVIGGTGGYLFLRAIRFGVTRGILSNEAGCGTAPIAHASANTKSPVEQGFWGIFEVFADTIVLCSMTAFVILLSYDTLVLPGKYDGIVLSLKAFERYFGITANYFLTIAIFFFAYATILCWYYYGTECLYYFTHSQKGKKTYLVFYCIAILGGASANSEWVMNFADFSVGIMTILNSVCLLLMSGIVRQLTKDYFSKTRI